MSRKWDKMGRETGGRSIYKRDSRIRNVAALSRKGSPVPRIPQKQLTRQAFYIDVTNHLHLASNPQVCF